jgi:hypothetical protein
MDHIVTFCYTIDDPGLLLLVFTPAAHLNFVSV